MEKIVIACCGSYLTNMGIKNVLEEHDGMFKFVMSGSNYIRGKRGIVLFAETLQRLQINAFASSSHNALKDAKLQKNMI